MEEKYLCRKRNKKKKEMSDPSGWDKFSVETWQGALIYFDNLYEDTNAYILEKIQGLPQPSNSIAVVEVGSGTGESLAPLIKAGCCAKAYGIDINEMFIKYSVNKFKGVPNLEFAVGDGSKLQSIMPQLFPGSDAFASNVVTCVGNSIGIIPEPIRSQIYDEMVAYAGDNGVVIVVYYNGNNFADGVENFYKKNPALCGEVIGEQVNLENCSLETKDGYKSKWTKPEEARELLTAKGYTVLEVKELGKGVAVTFKKGRN